MSAVRIRVRRIDHGLPLPSYSNPGDAGADLYASEEVTLAPAQRQLVRTGIALEIPDGYVGLVHPRSGLAHRHGLSMLNAPGTIDSGYRGEILVNLINLDPCEEVTLYRGDRIAQLLIQPVSRAQFVEAADLSDSIRGSAGHGSSGR